MLKALRHRLRQEILSRTSLHIGRRFFSDDQPPLFDCVELELRSLCNGTCPFCAAAIQFKSRPDQSMPEDIFRKIVGDLEALEYSGRICFYVNTEPLVDRRLKDFISYTRTRCPKSILHAMTNGVLLSNEIGEDLLDRGLDLLEINNYSDDKTVRPNIDRFMREVAPRFPGRVRLNMRPLNIQLNNRGGSAPNGRVLERPLRAFCQRPFQKLMINTQGLIGLCEHDFYFTEVMGDAKTQSLREIWYGKGFQRVRRALLEGDRTVNPLCAKCDFHGYRRVSNPREKYRGPLSTMSESIDLTLLRLANRVAAKL